MFFKALSVRNILLFLALISTPAYQIFAHDPDLQNTKHHIFAPGEKIHITVLNEPDLSNEYKIDDTGTILMPLIGKVHIANRSASEIETLLTTTLQNGYILEPVISVQTLQKNSFYILGAVKNPGYYDMPEEDLNILNAVALAGGFTRDANKKTVEIMRDRNRKICHTKNNPTQSRLRSGDIIIVKERFF